MSGWNNAASITINGQTEENVQKLPKTYGCAIYPIKIDDQDVHLVMRNGKLSLAVDAAKVDTGVKPPWWVYIFIGLCAILIFTDGALGAAAGAGFGMYSYMFACKKEKSNTAKFFVALGSTLAA